MYNALGNRDEQERIRLETPGARHCGLLEVNASACKGCQLNPHRRVTKPVDYSQIARHTAAILSSMQLYRLLKLGVRVDLANLSPKQVAELLVLDDEIERLRADEQNRQQPGFRHAQPKLAGRRRRG